ncbi:Mu-like prophage tail protein gpP [Noviherbaspirillum humi]|uniref:Mu-like prophage tail protein gpP n=1 Tax=Noviherbaspirillum humi TaxID=1688639 RepID=A0A239LEH7_9BURK|nr:contractile injection system protein, VgrG/Pvc8 family [Noviherbaspirillum humi]SNT29046.1 Mu-like prophage tail protein gpP [Noviherbaspirillum humi]
MTPSNLLTLRVGGQVFAGWKAITVRTGIEQLAGTFELGITERWPGQPKDWVIPPGEACSIEIGDDTVISGYVDAVAVSYDANAHDIKVTGRDRAGDLVDCSAPSTAFANQTFEQIASALCTPYGIEVFDETVGGKKLTTKQKKAGKKGTPPKKARVAGHVPKQACQNGETVFKTLEKLARNEGVLLVSDGEGGLVITRAGMGGHCATVLEQGKNILRASFEHSHAALFSEITVKGQAAAAGAGKFDLSTAAPKATVARAPGAKTGNSQITRYRPLIILAETQADARRCRLRAEWEAANREAKSKKVVITVQGWREPDTGELWQINKMVRVKCPWMRLDGWWLISSVTYKLDEGGSTADLSLVSDKAFDQLPEIPDPAAGATVSKFQVVKK